MELVDVVDARSASGSAGGAADVDVGAALEEALEEAFCEVLVVKESAPGAKRLVGGEDGGALVEAALVDDAVEDVGGGVGVVEVAHLVDDEDVRGDVELGGVSELADLCGGAELVDEVGGGDEARIEAVLDGL